MWHSLLPLTRFFPYVTLLCAGLLLGFTPPLSTPPTLTLQQALEMARQHNPTLKLAQHQLAQAQQRYHVGQAGFLPRLSTHLNTQANRPLGTSQATTTWQASLGASLQWNLFQGFQSIWTYQQLQKQSEMATLQVKQTAQDVLVEVARAYYQLALAQQKEKALEEHLATAQVLWEQEQAKYEVGNTSQLDYLAAQIHRQEAAQQLWVQKNQTARVSHLLQALLGQELPLQAYQLEEALPNTPALGALEDLLAASETNDWSLQKQQKAQEVAKLALKGQKGRWFPRLDVSLGYSGHRQRIEKKWGNWQKGWQLGFALSLDLFEALQHRTAWRCAQYEVQSAQLQYQAQRRQVRHMVAEKWDQYQCQQQRCQLVQQQQQLSQKRAEVAWTQYQLGSCTLVTLQQARHQLCQATLQYLEATYEAKALELELLQLGGGSQYNLP